MPIHTVVVVCKTCVIVAGVDEYVVRPAGIDVKVVAPGDGCTCQANIDTDRSVAVEPINGGRSQGFTVVDSSNNNKVCNAKC